MEIRTELPEDATAIHKLNAAAFGRGDEAALVDALRAVKALTLSLVAIEEGRIVGHIAFSPVTIGSEHRTMNAVGLGPMAVAPERQQSGIGTQLVETGMAELRKLGHTVVVVLGNPEFYSRFGFVSARHFCIHWEIEVPDDVFMIKELSEHALQGITGVAKYRPEFNKV